MEYITPFGTVDTEAAAHIDSGGGLKTTIGRAALVHETFSQFMACEAMNGTDTGDMAEALLTAVARVLVQFSANIALNNLGSMSPDNVKLVLENVLDTVEWFAISAAEDLSGKARAGKVNVVYHPDLKAGKQ